MFYLWRKRLVSTNKMRDKNTVGRVMFLFTQRVTLPQLLFTHFDRAKQLPAFSKSGTLGANRSKKLVQQMSVIKI